VFLLKPDGTTASNTWEGTFLIDPSTRESQKYLRDLFATLAGWGYDYFKIDGQPIVVREYRNKKGFMKSPADDTDELYRDTLESIREAIGPRRYLLGCWVVPLEGIGLMNGSRIGADVLPNWDGFKYAMRPTTVLGDGTELWHGGPQDRSVKVEVKNVRRLTLRVRRVDEGGRIYADWLDIRLSKRNP